MHQYDELLHERSGQAALVERAIAGDEAAFEAMYERHALSAWRLAYALTGTTRDAVEVVSESFARAFTALRAGRAAPVSFPALLLRTTRQRAIDVRRAHGESVPPFEASEQTLVLAKAFASLPERWKTALWLSHVEDLPLDDAASVIELSADATNQILGRARRGLREQFLRADTRESADRSCARSVARLSSYVAGTLPGSDVEKLERHLRLCPSCADRYSQLTALGAQLARLAPPIPAMLEDDVRIAWSGAVAPTSGPGLGRVGEKILAGVVAVAAGVAVLGAAIVSVSGTGDNDEAVAPIAPIVTELAAPRPPDMDLTIDLDPDRKRGRTFSPDDEFDGVVGTSARNGADDAVIADLGGGDTDTDAGGAPISGGGGDVKLPPAPTDPGSEDNGTPSGPAVNIGTDVGVVPVAVELGETPGVTAGPISVGSEPKPGGDPISVGGPLEPLAPVVQPVSGVLGG